MKETKMPKIKHTITIWNIDTSNNRETTYNNHTLQNKREHRKGKYWSMDKTKIGLKGETLTETMKRSLDERHKWKIIETQLKLFILTEVN